MIKRQRQRQRQHLHCAILLGLALLSQRCDPRQGLAAHPGPSATTKRVNASGGLKMRASDSLDSRVLSVVPEGASVAVIQERGAEIEISGRKGRWSLIEWKGQRGWVFGGFLGGPGESSTVVLKVAGTPVKMLVALEPGSFSGGPCCILKFGDSGTLRYGDEGGGMFHPVDYKVTAVVEPAPSIARVSLAYESNPNDTCALIIRTEDNSLVTIEPGCGIHPGRYRVANGYVWDGNSSPSIGKSPE